ncbi:hypothetical protein M3Y99_01867600 [Aphelenchoides fujianensis]|nr:hypothetical protein M3Y99_01867600 [Aphelenchoides fujianensis]
MTAVATEFGLNFAPRSLWFVLQSVGFFDPARLQWGPWVSLLFAADALLTAAVYRWTLLRTRTDVAKPESSTLLVKSQLNAVVTQLVDEFTPKVRKECTGRSDFNTVFRELSAAALRRFEQTPKWGEESHRAVAQKKLQDTLIAVFQENTE